MIVEQRIYTLHPGKIPEYMNHYRIEGRAIQEEILGRMIGCYYTDFGPQNQIIHMWGYQSYKERDERRTRLYANQAWKNFQPKVRPLILRQENKTLIPAPWSPDQ